MKFSKFSTVIFVSSAITIVCFCGCVSDEPNVYNDIARYQQNQVALGPQTRTDTFGTNLDDPLGLITPTPDTSSKDPDTPPIIPRITATLDPATGKKVYNITIEEAIVRALSNSPEIRIVSFNPEIAKEEITKAAGLFDVAAFGQLNYDKQDNPINSAFQAGQSDNRLLKSGLKQRATTGAEWSASYAVTRAWDDLALRTLSTRYEPVLAFEVKQPLMRDAGKLVNLSGVNVAKLNHQIALTAFKQRAEEVASEVMATYWVLYQTQNDVDIQQRLVQRTIETLERLQSRKEIDVTQVQLKQTETSLKSRQAILIQFKKTVLDVQDALLRLLADSQMNLIDDITIVPQSQPSLEPTRNEVREILTLAMRNNPILHQRRLAVEVADINVEVAKNQKMPRLDLVASARTQALDRDYNDAHNELDSGDYVSYSIGVSFEYPLGNRQRKAEFRRRRLERSKAVSDLQNIADQVATQTKEQMRAVNADYEEIFVQDDAVKAATIYLRSLEDTEKIRKQLTPEFMLVKLQAQEDLANAKRSHVRTIADYNVSLARLAQITGTVLEFHNVKPSMLKLTADTKSAN